ncbi:hypothetical protein Pcinc_016842 [Petrolisthes cinctipes]|uniref:Uncharacterized protein n=1 Tax=Petrolisthes cinctipes TaxID=88211 RepID=A0AAE1KP55_PETCI|nr:hypothetical protein Pcinc_016842 [Petrolisthes cinctipes]
MVQRSFTRQIRGMRDLSYWDRLMELGLYSQQRRRDRYRVIYKWKILEGQVLNPAPLALSPYTTERTGCKCIRSSLPTTRVPERIRTLLASSLIHEGPKVFNALLKEVRNTTGCPVENFKSPGLDKFLWTVSDEPPVLVVIIGVGGALKGYLILSVSFGAHTVVITIN